ncbi:Xaa-Pro aminopeptidase [Orbaceae bacterium ESL0721]|nr:Xaa-Pro aminopeptidase [Orbaceae bacterium ESL0721]
MITADIKQELLTRRNKFMAEMIPNSAAIFFAAPEAIRSNDTHYPYRQNSDFWYLTLFAEPEAVLLLIKPEEPDQTVKSVLFNRKKDPVAEIWTGYRLGQEAAVSDILVDEAYLFDDIEFILPKLLNGKTALYHADSQYLYADHIVKNVMNTLREGGRQGFTAPTILIDWRPILHTMRMFKSDFEIELMREAGKIAAKAHVRAMQHCRPSMYEYQLEAEILYEFANHGARFPSYNTIVGSGNNGCTLHYENNSCQLQSDDLVLIDAGCEYNYYASDITRTFPVNGKFTPAQREIYNIVLASQYRAIELFKPGVSIQEVNQQVVRIMVTGLVELGIMQGDVNRLIEEKAYLNYYMHGLGHWLGIDVHDVGSDRNCPLQSGMVLTVEPGLYINQHADVPAQYRGIGIRIEDNIIITDNGNTVLTGDVPKDPDAIEALMAKRGAS